MVVWIMQLLVLLLVAAVIAALALELDKDQPGE